MRLPPILDWNSKIWCFKVMGYEALARKWRPKVFAEVVGQAETVKALVNALDSDRLHHAYLFSGSRGIGKTTLARIFAKSLNCNVGVSSMPCGACSSCLEIDQGRMIDLIEVDAASRTKVEETRQLLDNVQYAPTRSRFKIYLIDEIHMFSKHSFNALLKTLEEPPAHVKFLLATTDPEKLPVTVLSRCLKFGLRKVGVDIIADQIQSILRSEKIPFEEPALTQIARSADGSVRDALSLLDQAIVHGNGTVNLGETGKMLGLASFDSVIKIFELVSQGKGKELLAISRELGMQTSNFELILKQMLDALRKMAIIQVVGVMEHNGVEEDANLIALSGKVSQEDCQLYYEIVLQGLKNLEVTTDYESAFEMILLRLLAFVPCSTSSKSPLSGLSKEPVSGRGKSKKEIKDVRVKGVGKKGNGIDVMERKEESDSEWATLVDQLDLTGLPRELARNSVLSKKMGNVFFLEVSNDFSSLTQPRYVESIEEAIGKQLKLEVAVKFNLSAKDRLMTPADTEKKTIEKKKMQVESELLENPNIGKLRSVFDAELDGLNLKN